MLGLMKRISVMAVGAMLMVLPVMAEDASNYANYARYADANAQLEKNVPGRVVLMGNSITDGWPKKSAGFFEAHPQFVGRGISGQTSHQFLLRFRRDVVDLNPEIVVINYGTNDIALNGGPYDEDITFGNVLNMVDIARANGIKVVLASCLPAEGFRWRPEVTDAMDKIRSLNKRVKAYADEQGIPYADYFTALLNEDGTALDSRYAGDMPAVHPNEAGYAIMEEVLLNTLAKLKD